VREAKQLDFDYAIMLCDSAARACPVLPGKSRLLHRGFEDTAQVSGTREEVVSVLRLVRDGIREFVHSLPELLSREERT
jgi:arsenate reductase